VIAQIPDTAAKFGITTPLRLAHLLGQCSHESGNFVAIRENLNYSIKGLMGVFGKYFTTEAVATSAGLFVATYFFSAIAFDNRESDISSTGLEPEFSCFTRETDLSIPITDQPASTAAIAKGSPT
jgi:hypothetical protein